MDTEALVTHAHQLADLLDREGILPGMMMWFRDSDTENWRLWIVPHKTVKDERDFYRRLSNTISSNRHLLSSLHASDIDMIDEHHPAIGAIRGMAAMLFGGRRGKCSIKLSQNLFNGLFIPDGVLVLL